MQHFITPTLIDNLDFLMNAPPSWSDKAYKSVMDTLLRKWSPMSPEIQRGVNVERKICSALHLGREEFKSTLDDMSPCVEMFWDKCSGGSQQVVTKKTIFVGDREVLLYGKMDVYFSGKKIIDIKTTRSFKGDDKYLSKSQHLLYMRSEDVYNFEYIVAIFKGVESEKEFTVRPIDASVPKEECEAELNTKIIRAFNFMEDDKSIWKAYTESFNAKK
jgi:hypothetical protein